MMRLMMLRVRFSKHCHAARRTWRPNEEGDFTADLAAEIASMGVGEIIGEAEPSEPIEPVAAAEKPRRARKPKESNE